MNLVTTDVPSLQLWDSRIALLEQTLRSYGYKTECTFKFKLGDDRAFLWSRRFSKVWQLVFMAPEYKGKGYEVCPFIEADYAAVEKYESQLLAFFTYFMEYCELEPRHLW